MTASSAKVWFIGLDSLEPDLLRAAAAAGRCPNLATLLARGGTAVTSNSTGLYVGAVWPSFATATGCARHGRACYTQLSPNSYRSKIFGVRQLRGDPFWRRASAAGVRCAIVDLPKSLLSRDIDGAHVVDWGTHDPEEDGFGAVPASLERTIRDEIGPSPFRTCDELRRTAAHVVRFRDDLVERAKRRVRIFEAALETTRPALAAVAFTETHCSGHQLWHLHDETHDRHDPRIVAEIGDPLLDVLAAVDACVGQVLALAPSDARILVLLSHGMGRHYDGVNCFDEALERLEPFLPAGKPPSLYGRFARLLDRKTTRRWSRSLEKRFGRGLPLPPRAAGRTSFMIPNNDAWAGVRVNLVGREPRGRIRPGAEYDEYLARLATLLGEWKNGVTGEPVFGTILRTDTVHALPHAAPLPDLLAEWRRDAPIRSITSERIGTVEGRYNGLRSGDHRSDGLAIVVGPGIPRGPLPHPVPTEDLSPTLLAWAGVDWPGVDGRPVAEWCPGR